VIDEQQLRAVVREVIAQKVGRASAPEAWGRASALQPGATGVHLAVPQACASPTAHASHGLVRMIVTTQQDGPCVIEPHVMCDHCGYCKSLGH
jgi:hypothetical protein